MQTLTGTCGSNKTPCTIFEHDGWYCVEGSVNVNMAPPGIIPELAEFNPSFRIDVESIQDVDMFTASKPIESEEELVEEIEE